MELNTILNLFPEKGGREELRQLGRDYQQSKARRGQGPPPEQLMDEIYKRVLRQFRNIRHPLPTRQEMERMVIDHFQTKPTP